MLKVLGNLTIVLALSRYAVGIGLSWINQRIINQSPIWVEIVKAWNFLKVIARLAIFIITF